uniref:Uncharacterized protein n=1 Tax=Arundo donax TaxID=35708 RepID=A0A0A8YCQ3_ARUDO
MRQYSEVGMCNTLLDFLNLVSCSVESCTVYVVYQLWGYLFCLAFIRIHLSCQL